MPQPLAQPVDVVKQRISGGSQVVFAFLVFVLFLVSTISFINSIVDIFGTQGTLALNTHSVSNSFKIFPGSDIDARSIVNTQIMVSSAKPFALLDSQGFAIPTSASLDEVTGLYVIKNISVPSDGLTYITSSNTEGVVFVQFGRITVQGATGIQYLFLTMWGIFSLECVLVLLNFDKLITVKFVQIS